MTPQRSRARLDHNDHAGLIDVLDALDGAVLLDENGQPGVQVGIGKVDGLAPFIRRGHRGDNQVDPARLQRRNEALERHVLEVDRAMQIIGERMGEIDADPARIPRCVGHLKGRVIQFHADDKRLGGIIRADRKNKCG